MEKLSLCRMCLAKNIPMRYIVKKNLQEMFKQLTAVPLVTEDCRPAVACVMCCARLQNCYEFMNNCLQSEELLQQVLNSDVLTPVTLEQLPSAKKLGKSRVVLTNYPDNTEANVDGQTSVIYDVEVKKEITEDENVESNEEQYIEYDGVTRWSNTEVDPLDEYKHDIMLKTVQIENDICDDNYMTDEQQTPRGIQSKKHKDTISHMKNKLNLEKPSMRSRYQTSHKQPNKNCARPGNKQHECDFCKKRFNSRSSLKTHLRIHTGDKPYKCNICGKRFSQKSNLVTHNRIHTGEKPYKCSVCSKCFTEKEGLVKHTRTHTGDKPYKCNICNKCFTQKGDFVIHNRKHTGNTPYKCNICNISFTLRKYLDRSLISYTLVINLINVMIAVKAFLDVAI